MTNAQVFCALQKEYQTFAVYLWSWSGGAVIRENGFTRSPLFDAISRDLKERGMKFIGSTVAYAYLQAVGVISAHEDGCFFTAKERERRNGGIL